MKKSRVSPSLPAPSVAKAIRLPNHALSKRLQAVLELVDRLQAPRNLKTVTAVMDSTIRGGRFVAFAATGPYAIRINPQGSHPELSLLHETAHFLEWHTIPKLTLWDRDFLNDSRFDGWLDAVRVSPNYQRIIDLRDQHEPHAQSYDDLAYLLRPAELWARAHSQYIARKGEDKAAATVLLQQMAAENKVTTGKILYQPYWPWSEFPPVQDAMEELFKGLRWTR